MPFIAGETADLAFTGDPDTTVFEFLGQRYTLANGGLDLKRKSCLHVLVRLPRERGKYPYKWSDGEQIVTGHLRVQGGQRAKPAQAREAQASEPPFKGVRVRRA